MAGSFSTKLLFTGKNFKLQHSLRPVMQVNYNIAGNRYHPLYEKVQEKLKAQDKHQLIINVAATIKKTSPKAVVRKRSVHRVLEATHQVLKENGYEKDGKAEDCGKDLVGTLAFWTTAETVVTPWEELKEEVRYAVGKWIHLRSRDGDPVNLKARKATGPRLLSQRYGKEDPGRRVAGYGREGTGPILPKSGSRPKEGPGAKTAGYPGVEKGRWEGVAGVTPRSVAYGGRSNEARYPSGAGPVETGRVSKGVRRIPGGCFEEEVGQGKPKEGTYPLRKMRGGEGEQGEENGVAKIPQGSNGYVKLRPKNSSQTRY